MMKATTEEKITMNVERRFASQRVSLGNLNCAQRSAFDGLAQNGFGLLFIRSTQQGKIAVCSSGSEFATIDEYGQMIKTSSFELRR